MELLFKFSIMIVCFLIYLAPAIIAIVREHQNAMPIIAVNLLLGWTFLGWVAPLAWSLAHQEPRDNA